MKVLLRSSFVGEPTDNAEQLLQNYLALQNSGLPFIKDEDTVIWSYIQDFVAAHKHVPDYSTLRAHFKRLQAFEVYDRLEHLQALPTKARGDFLKRMEDRADERRVKRVKDILTEAAEVLSVGREVDDGKGNKRILRGPIDAIRFVMDSGHDVVTPTTGIRLSGNVTQDGEDFLEEYDRIKNDPLAGIGQFCGIEQIDQAIKGAKRHELWTHAAFTGGLKCVAGDTRIYDLTTGRLRTVKELHESGDAPLLHSLDEKAWRMTQAKANTVFQNGVRPIFRITTHTGRAIRVSGNHPFRTPSGWTNADDLQAGDWVAVPAQMSGSKAVSPFSDAVVGALGYLLGDGCIKNDISFCNGNPAIIEDFVQCLEAMGYLESLAEEKARFPAYRYQKSRPGYQTVRVSKSTGRCPRHPWASPLREHLENLGLWGCTSGDKHIPLEMWRMTDSQVWIMLSSLWATDGSIKVEPSKNGRRPKPVVTYTSKSKQLTWDIQALLQRMGVPSTVSKVVVKYQGAPRIYWSVLVTTNEGKRRFLSHVHVAGKGSAVAGALEATPEGQDTDWMPPALLADLGDSVRAQTRKGGWHYAKWVKKKGQIQRDTFSRLAEASGKPDLIRKAQGDVRWERLIENISDGEEMTYDLSVPGPENFVANGFIIHNSTFMLNWSYNQAVYYGHDSLIFSLEMPYHQCRRLVYCLHSSHEKFASIHPPLDYQRTRDGELTPAEELFLKEHVVPDFNDPKNAYGNVFIEVADPDKIDFTVADMRARAEMLYSNHPFRTLFVDHALLVSPRKWVPSTTERLNEVIRDCKKMSMSFNRGMGLAVVLLFQISREGYKAATKQREKESVDAQMQPYNLTHLSYANEAERCVVSTCLIAEKLQGYIRVGAVIPGDLVWSSTGWRRVLNRFDNGVRRLWLVTTDRGSILEATSSHRIRVVEDGRMDWKAVKDLTTADFVAGAFGGCRWPDEWPTLPPLDFRRYEHKIDRMGEAIRTPAKLTTDLSYLFGAWDGDGKVLPDGISYTGNRLEVAIREGLCSRIASTFSSQMSVDESPSRPRSFDIRKFSRPLKRWFEELAGPRGLEVPGVILRAPKEAVLAYLRGLFDTDGWINNQGVVGINLKGASEPFLRDVQMLLTGLGIDSHLALSRPLSKQTGKRYSKVALRIRSRKGRELFSQLVGFTDAKRTACLDAFVTAGAQSDRRGDVQMYPVPETFLRVYALVHPPGTPQKRFRRAFYNVPNHVRRTGLVSLGALQTLHKAALADGIHNDDVSFMGHLLELQVMRVVSVEDTGRDEQVVDLEVEGDHEYQTGPILSHNSSDNVTATWIDPTLASAGQVLFQHLKSRDQEPFKPFKAQILWPNRRLSTLHDVPEGEAAMVGDDIDSALEGL